MKNITRILALCTALMVIAGCDKDNPVDADAHSGHADASGLVITGNGSEIVRYEEGAVTGVIDIKSGEETGDLQVRFIDDHDGDLFTPDTDHHTLDWHIADDTITGFIPFETRVSDDDAWKFRLAGLAAGETTLEIKILHEDHVDFLSLPIPVRVSD